MNNVLDLKTYYWASVTEPQATAHEQTYRPTNRMEGLILDSTAYGDLVHDKDVISNCSSREGLSNKNAGTTR